MLTVLSFAMLAAAAQAGTEMSVEETRVLVRQYGDCVVRKRAAMASQAIVANVDNSTLLRRYARLIDPTCVPVQSPGRLKVRFQGDQYRYALADALVRRELAASPAPNLDAVPRLDHRDPGPAPTRVDQRGRPLKEKAYQEVVRGHAQNRAFSYLSRYGECVVRVDPRAARALLLTEPASPAEAAHFAAMRTAFGTCVPEGETLSFGKLALRGTVAINYYRLAKAAAAVTNAGEAG